VSLPLRKVHSAHSIINQNGLESCTFILRPNYERINKLDVINPGIPWSVIPPIQSSQVELGYQFMGRVEKGLKCWRGTRRGPRNLHWKMIGNRKTIVPKLKNYELGCGPSFLEWMSGVQGEHGLFG
jgi:hypothetical protein